MKKNRTLLIGIVGFIIMIGGAYFLYHHFSDDMPDVLSEENDEAAQTEVTAAPDFTVVDSDGASVRLADAVGKPIVLNFWASWCGPCKEEMPVFDRMYTEQKETVQFFMVNMTDGARETTASASDYVKKQGYSFPVLYDTSSEAATAYGVYSIPVTFFIDAEGMVAARVTGTIDEETLRQGIDMISH